MTRGLGLQRFCVALLVASSVSVSAAQPYVSGSDASVNGISPTAANTLRVYEFFHPTFNHYFITAYPDEAASLMAGGLPPWTATGQTFDVWAAPGSGITNVCRFFSATFAPKSAHFYSNAAAECPALAQRGVWTLEASDAFYMMASPAGSCPTGTTALYRVYNNGIGGAPNHRYTTSLVIRQQMIAAGWIPEGNGPDGVFACVPAPAASAFQQEVTAYASPLLDLLISGGMNGDEFLDLLTIALNAAVTPGTTCPVATTDPDLTYATNLPLPLTIYATFGKGCFVRGDYISGTVAGGIVIRITNLAVTDMTLDASMSFEFDDLTLNGQRVGNGSLVATESLVANPVTGTITGSVDLTYGNFQTQRITLDGTSSTRLISATTAMVAVNVTTNPGNVRWNLSTANVVRPDGSVIVNTTGVNTVDAYTVQITNLVINPAVCPTGATSGTIRFTNAGRTGTLTFNGSCSFAYSGP